MWMCSLKSNWAVLACGSMETTVTSTDTAFPVGFSRCLWQELFHPPTPWPHPRKETAWRTGAARGQVNCFSSSISPAREQSRSAELTEYTIPMLSSVCFHLYWDSSIILSYYILEELPHNIWKCWQAENTQQQSDFVASCILWTVKGFCNYVLNEWKTGKGGKQL